MLVKTNRYMKMHGETIKIIGQCSSFVFAMSQVEFSVRFPVIVRGSTTPVSVKGKVKCTLIQALRLCTGRTTHRGSRVIDVTFLDYGTRRGRGSSLTSRPLFTPGKGPVHIVQEVDWVPGSVWTGAENFAPTGIRSPDRPDRSQSLY